MGISNGLQWICYLVKYAIVVGSINYLIVYFLTTAVISGEPLPNSDANLVLAFFMLYGLNITLLCFLVASVFSSRE